MLTKMTLSAITPVVQNAMSAELRMVPLANTPIATLVEHSLPVTDLNQVEPERVLDVVESCALQLNLESVPMHAVVMDEVVEVIGNSVEAQFKYAREVVVPTIGKVVGNAKSKLDETGLPTYSVERLDLAAIHSNPVVEELLSRWAERQPAQVQGIAGFPQKDESEIVTAMQTGNATLDGQLADMIASHPAGWVAEIYTKFFVTGNGLIQPKYAPALIDQHLVVHLLARAFMDTPPENSGMSLSSYNLAIAGLLEQTAVQMNTIHQYWLRMRRQGIVVLSYAVATGIPTSVEDGVIQVFGDVYDKFLAEGGTPEVIIGANLSDRAVDLINMTEKKDKYLMAYQNYARNADIERTNRLGALLRDVISREVSIEIINLPEVAVNPHVEREALHAMAKDALSAFNDHQLITDLYKVVRHVLCKSVFGHTDSLKILQSMDEYMADGAMEPRDAAYRVCIDMVVEHLLSQVEITK